MLFHTLSLFALAAIPAAWATDAPVNYAVSVGADGQLAYKPEYVNAKINDTVTFFFHPKNHTVTQSTFDEPCLPILSGLNSGFNPVANESVDVRPSFTVTVNTEAVTWIYCQQKGHCGQGMVFAINPPATGDHTFEAFKARAMQINGTTSSSAASVSSTTSSGSVSTAASAASAASSAHVTLRGIFP